VRFVSKMLTVNRMALAINARTVSVEQRVELPALLHRNAVLLKDHVITVWLEFVHQEDVELPVLSNLIVLAMEIAHFVQQHMDALPLVEEHVSKILIVEEIPMVVDLALIAFVFNPNVEQLVNQDLIIPVIQLTVVHSVILPPTLQILVLKDYHVTLLVK